MNTLTFELQSGEIEEENKDDAAVPQLQRQPLLIQIGKSKRMIEALRNISKV